MKAACFMCGEQGYWQLASWKNLDCFVYIDTCEACGD